MDEVNPKLVMYIQKEILPQYESNIGGHDIRHVQTVIDRSFEILEAFSLVVNRDMVYTVAAYHDIGYKVDPDNHEKVSSEIFERDEKLKGFFDDYQIAVMSEAIYDHRASLEYECRNIYGKIVSSADRETSVNNMLERSFLFQSDKHIGKSEDEIIEYSYQKLLSKYGKGGYAKMYYPDEKYLNYLTEMQYLLENKDEFIQREKEISIKLSKTRNRR